MKLLNATSPKERLFQVELSESELRALGFAIVNIPIDDIRNAIPKGVSAYHYCLDLKHSIDKALSS